MGRHGHASKLTLPASHVVAFKSRPCNLRTLGILPVDHNGRSSHLPFPVDVRQDITPWHILRPTISTSLANRSSAHQAFAMSS